jgi:hypothetical protein
MPDWSDVLIYELDVRYIWLFGDMIYDFQEAK